MQRQGARWMRRQGARTSFSADAGVRNGRVPPEQPRYEVRDGLDLPRPEGATVCSQRTRWSLSTPWRRWSTRR
eukprot:15224293-Heterocapsa_arctica.AAC.1